MYYGSKGYGPVEKRDLSIRGELREQSIRDEVLAATAHDLQTRGAVRLPSGTYDLYADPDECHRDDVIVYHPTMPAPVAISNRDLPTTLPRRSDAMNGREWTERELKLLGSDLDSVIARKVGRSTNAVRKKRQEQAVGSVYRRDWKARELKLLGTMPDAGLAERLGCSRLCIFKKRRSLGIAAFSPSNAPKQFRR